MVDMFDIKEMVVDNVEMLDKAVEKAVDENYLLAAKKNKKWWLLVRKKKKRRKYKF